MGALDGGISKAIAKGFKGKLLKGRIMTPAGSAVNGLGDTVVTSKSWRSFEGFRSDYSAFYRKNAGIPDEDVKVVIIAGSISSPPLRGDTIELRSTYYQVRNVRVDPASAVYQCQCFQVPAP